MSNHEQPTPSHPKSDVRNTTGRNKQILQDSVRTTSVVDLEEFCEKHYKKLLPIMADKYEYEKRKKEKLDEVKARLDFDDARKKSTRAQESALRRERSRSPRHEYKNKERRESTVFKRLGSKGRSTSAHSDSRQESSRYTENYSESEDSEGGHWKSKLRRKKSSIEDDDLSQPWVCAETDPFTSRIRHFDFPKTRMPSHVKTYNGSEDPEDHLKIFQAAAKTERWAMPTWCHMFNSTLTGNARKKCIRDPIVLHNIKQRDEESTEDFIQRYKSESGNVKGAPECMRISGFVHGITNPDSFVMIHTSSFWLFGTYRHDFIIIRRSKEIDRDEGTAFSTWPPDEEREDYLMAFIILTNGFPGGGTIEIGSTTSASQRILMNHLKARTQTVVLRRYLYLLNVDTLGSGKSFNRQVGLLDLRRERWLLSKLVLGIIDLMRQKNKRMKQEGLNRQIGKNCCLGQHPFVGAYGDCRLGEKKTLGDQRNGLELWTRAKQSLVRWATPQLHDMDALAKMVDPPDEFDRLLVQFVLSFEHVDGAIREDILVYRDA
ncbi:hypothetical protein Tco_1018602 [Tanacetum coccineum]|uniref:Reverse transcriptase domain-containing protein n=1 Tax=Tanacetum coccineum TaxID=301880 RepID=A0ABQ5FWS4_9ASTR